MFARWLSLAVAVSALFVLLAPGSATAAEGLLRVTANTFPSNLPPGGTGTMQVNVENVGAEAVGLATVTDTLPVGVIALPARNGCTGTKIVTCNVSVAAGSVAKPEETSFPVEVQSGVSGTLENKVTVTDEGTSTATVAPVTISPSRAGPGFANFDAWLTNADGTADEQAGSHPYALTVTFNINSENVTFSTGTQSRPVGGPPRTLIVNLPPGLVGDPGAVAQCTRQELDGGKCPADSQVGVDTVYLTGAGEPGEVFPLQQPVYNIVPPAGTPAEFAFELEGFPTFVDSGVQSSGDYGLVARATNIPAFEVLYNSATIWGVVGGKPFLTLPTSCGVSLPFGVETSPWVEPPSEQARTAFEPPTGLMGCEHLSFNPSIFAAPDTDEADTPAGLTTEVRMPQEGLTVPGQYSESDLKDVTVTLPEGFTVNPGQAAGLAACGFAESGVGTEEAPACPTASRVGTVKIRTPLLEVGELERELEGEVYILKSNPPNLLLLVAASADGINIKLVGRVHLDETTGQLTAKFGEAPALEAEIPSLKGHLALPQLPFSNFKLSFSGGPQAALVTPSSCGIYETTSDFTPWGAPSIADALRSSRVEIAAGPEGSSCVSSLPFDPSMIAGATTDQAGGYTDFTFLLQKANGQQPISAVRFKAPSGLLGMISKVSLCPEPQASLGACALASQIGHVVTAAGAGPYPLVVPQPGEPQAPIYITGPYGGAPFGLSIAVPVIAGPFNLGTVVVRARIEIDPHTAQIIIAPNPLPTILDGVPVDYRSINTVIDRQGFMFNPTNCDPMSFNGTATSVGGTTAPLESHFQVGSCRSLKFTPHFTVSTSGKTSREDGASLTAKLTYPSSPLGVNQESAQSNIARVKVELPKRLPSRLKTLQKACRAAVFEENPASCPAASIVGHAKVLTPVLPVELTGPVYFVSHGGEAFPSLVVVLQGDNVTADVEASTFISKKGITSSTFKSVPDVPFRSFELTLPEGPYSALAANGKLCKGTLKIPTEFVAQNGAEIHEDTKISVTGCPKVWRKGHASARRKRQQNG